MKIFTTKNTGRFLVIFGFLLFLAVWPLEILLDTENPLIKKLAITIVVLGFLFVYGMEKMHQATQNKIVKLKCKKCNNIWTPDFILDDFHKISLISFNLPVFCKCPLCKKRSWCKSV